MSKREQAGSPVEPDLQGQQADSPAELDRQADPRMGLVARVAGWTSRHRRTALLAWLVALVAALGASHGVGTNFSNSLSLPGTASQQAVDLLRRDFPAQAGDQDQIVFAVAHGSVTAAPVRARIAPALASVARLAHVTAVVSPYSARSAHQIAPEGKVAYATVIFDRQARSLPDAAINRVIATAQHAGGAGVQVALGGQAIQHVQRPSLGTGIGLAGLGSQLTQIPDFATELAAMIGLGVGIDYSLFIVTRFRENYRAGMMVPAAIAGAMDTAGRAVVFAGSTVIVALLGQLLLGVAFLDGLAVASALAVFTTMLAALTVLPALLARFGERVGRASRRRLRQPAATAPRPSRWLRWSQLIARHPWPGAVAGAAIMLALAVPALSVRLGASDAGNDATSLTTRHAYDLLARGFGAGANGPLQVVVSLPHATDPAALHTISRTLADTPDVESVSAPRLSPNERTAVLNVSPRSSPQSGATTNLVQRLRQDELPRATRATAATILIGGASATEIDFTHVLRSKLPLFIGVVLVLSALLLTLAFRSLVIPVQAAVMNLLSIGASLGTVVAIFQWGWLGSLFDVQPGPIEAFIPVILFAIVFGLSMDYEVFIISRINEEWLRRRDPTAAVHHGVASTGRVITAAATIMICVFASFALGDQRDLKLFGLSLASAVFLDAFVVRSLLLPSVLQLLGARTWWMPSWLERRVPHLAIDRELHPLIPAWEEA